MVSCYVRSRHHPLYGGTFLLIVSSVSPIPSYPPCWDTDHTYRDSATTQLPLCRLLYSVCLPPDGATSILHCGTTIPDGHCDDDDHDDCIVMPDARGDGDDADDIIHTTVERHNGDTAYPPPALSLAAALFTVKSPVVSVFLQ